MIILYFIGFILVVITIIVTGYWVDVYLYGKERTLASYRYSFYNNSKYRYEPDSYDSYNYNHCRRSSAESQISSNRSQDPFNVHAFDTPEEFYEECGDEFHDFEDAADYFNNYRK